MSDEKAETPKPPAMPDTPPRPDIPEVRYDSIGRPMDPNKPRGRKPGSQNKAAQANASPTLSGELKKRLPEGSILSDENVGKAIAGAFGAIGIFGGPHWRLMKLEQDEYGTVFGPLARMYGPDELAKWITILMALPVVTSTVMPRLAIQNMIHKKELDKERGRVALIQIKAMMAAEEGFNIEAQIQEEAANKKDFFVKHVNAAHEATAQVKAEQVSAEMNGVTVPTVKTPSEESTRIPGDERG